MQVVSPSIWTGGIEHNRTYLEVRAILRGTLYTCAFGDELVSAKRTAPRGLRSEAEGRSILTNAKMLPITSRSLSFTANIRTRASDSFQHRAFGRIHNAEGAMTASGHA